MLPALRVRAVVAHLWVIVRAENNERMTFWLAITIAARFEGPFKDEWLTFDVNSSGKQ